MLTAEFHLSLQGSRREQLDRFLSVDTGQCSLFMMADGFSQCNACPHYVDWLTERLRRLAATDMDVALVCREISEILQVRDCFPGKASVAFVVADDRQYRYATLGDTRIYWLNRSYRTRDHSLAERCVELSHCPPDALSRHPLRNRLTAWAGSGNLHALKWHNQTLSPAEHLLICTDGFWSQVSEADINGITSGSLLNDLCSKLNARTRGCFPDNLTVTLLRPF
jgi:PPM family protein phosphatase